MIIYTDRTLYAQLLQHPGLMIDKEHPAVKLQRYAKDGKSIFKLNETNAVMMFRYYKDQWNTEMYDEFGEQLYSFKEILGKSYCEDNLTLTIKELFDAQEVEKELLKATTEGD